MKYHPNIVQGELDWLKLHLGRVTASQLDQLLTPEWELKKGEMPRTFAYKKAAELWRNAPILSTGSWATEQGQMREDEAIAFAALEYGYRITKMGFCESDDSLCGCSPDGLIGENSGIEMKSPEPPNHVKYVCEGRLPKDYAAQVHGSMFVTGRPEWVFFSYHRGFPPFHLVVKRDEEIIIKIGEAVTMFHRLLNDAMKALKSVTP